MPANVEMVGLEAEQLGQRPPVVQEELKYEERKMSEMTNGK